MRWTASTGLLLTLLVLFIALPVLGGCGGVVCTGSGCYWDWDPWYPWYPWWPYDALLAGETADLDADGVADILFLEDGARAVSLTHGAAMTVETVEAAREGGSSSCRVLAAQFDDDAPLDLAILVEATGTLTVHRGTPSGVYLPPVPQGRLELGPAVADLSVEPGEDDEFGALVVEYADGRTVAYPLDGQGGFAP